MTVPDSGSRQVFIAASTAWFSIISSKQVQLVPKKIALTSNCPYSEVPPWSACCHLSSDSAHSKSVTVLILWYQQLVVLQEHVGLLRELVAGWPEQHADLGLLLDHDAELDFFNNVAHLQLHRRQRALNRLTKVVTLLT